MTGRTIDVSSRDWKTWKTVKTRKVMTVQILDDPLMTQKIITEKQMGGLRRPIYLLS